MSQLKTLEQHNAERHQVIQAFAYNNDPRPNGIACPECGAELLDSEPMVTLTSDPPMKNVHCDKCYYRGYRLA
jgi:hypothetical protein